MAISLTYDGDTILLPDALYWPDEFGWQKVMQNMEYTITGSLVLETATRLAGRPITLVGDLTATWLVRADLKILEEWKNVAGRLMTLVIRGETFAVAFNQGSAPIEFEPLVAYSDPDDTDVYSLTLRFIEVPA